MATKSADDVSTVVARADVADELAIVSSGVVLTDAATLVTGPSEAPDLPLRGAEIESLKRQTPFAVALVLVAAVLLFLDSGPTRARFVLQASLVVALVATAMGVYGVRNRRVCTPAFLTLHAMLNAACFAGACYYVGAFSPLVGFLFLNQYRGSSSPRGRLDVVQYGVNAVMLLAIQLPSAFGVPDPGLIRADDLGPAAKIMIVIAVQLGLAAALVFGRAQRERLLDAIRLRDNAVRTAATQGALLIEAQQAFDRALQVGGLGRFSEQTIGNYRLGAIIGRGGMGEVYEAVHLEDNSEAAVKLLRSSALDDPEIVRRFLREVSVVCRVRSPRIVEVLSFGGDTLPYIAMERLHGEDLAVVLRRDTVLPLDELSEMVTHVAEALEVASAADIVHRDLKPSNIFRCNDPRSWKVLDFGVAKVGDAASNLTAGNMIGTLHYMAPEQARGVDVDTRADLFALAAITYRALCGRPPFPAGEPLKLLRQILYDAPAAPSKLAHTPEQVDWVFAIALAKRPEDRFAQPLQFASALSAALAGKASAQLERRAKSLLDKHPWSESEDATSFE